MMTDKKYELWKEFAEQMICTLRLDGEENGALLIESEMKSKEFAKEEQFMKEQEGLARDYT